MLKQKKEAKDCENDSLKKQVEALQSMLGGNCPILPDNGLDVLTNLKVSESASEAIEECDGKKNSLLSLGAESGQGRPRGREGEAKETEAGT